MERHLSDLLARLPIPGLKESTNRHIVADLLTEILHTPITASQIKIKDEILSLAIPPVLKSAVYLHTEDLLKRLREQNIVVVAIK